MPIDDSRPIWVQLVDDFRMRIVTGAWPAGTRIPSVRDLATPESIPIPSNAPWSSSTAAA